MPSRRLALMALLGLLVAPACSGSKLAPGEAPSVLLITLDTTRADHLGCYGRGVNTTPNLDRLARHGARFELCIATAAVTPVSHASILTGLNPYEHGLRVLNAGRGYRLSEHVPTVASTLKEAGFRTGAFLSSFPVSEHFGLDRGFERFDNGMDTSADDPHATEKNTPSGKNYARNQRRADLTTSKAIEWIEGSEGPFLAWVHYFDPHDPNLVPPKEHARPFRALDIDEGAKVPTGYDAEIRYMDRQIGRLLKAVERFDEMIIIVTADHGEGLGEHGWHAHRLLYQEQLHVPLIVRAPGVPEGRAIGDLVRTIDVFPTVLELLGMPSPADVAGRSLVGLMDGEPDAPRVAYADQLNLWDANSTVDEKRPADDLLHCVMDGEWKLIYRPLRPDESELYHLPTDPDEAVNLYTDRAAERDRLVQDLLSRDALELEGFGKEHLSDEASARLGELGYAEDSE